MASTGEQLGRYHLVRKLATGGMAEIFLAKVVGPGGFEKSLVIKRILPNLAKDPEFVSMFLQEARLAAQFAHPSVVQIFDFGEVNGAYFLAMEYVDGPNLRSVLKSSPDRRLPLALGARIIEEACEGLAYVHDFTDPNGAHLGLMHCDVSTDNMLIARNGTVKVVDFGLATTSTQMASTAPGTVKGKIAYMPPEQIIGEADLRADVYALGVILYELAAGTRPYEQMPDQQLLAAIIKTDPVPLLSRRPDVPRAYANIVAKAMAKNLAERFQSCHELAAALEEFVVSTGERVGPRQIAALVTQLGEDSPRPITSGTPVTATPFSRQTPARISPPHGLPVAPAVKPAPPPRDPFAAFSEPVSGKTAPSKPRADPFAAFGAPRAASPATPSPSAPPPPPPAENDLFNQFFSDLVDDAAAPPPPPSAPKTTVPLVSRAVQTVTLNGDGETATLPRGPQTVRLDGAPGAAQTVTLDGAPEDLEARVAAVLERAKPVSASKPEGRPGALNAPASSAPLTSRPAAATSRSGSVAPGIAPLTQGGSVAPGIAPLAQGSSSPSSLGSVAPGIAPLAQGSSPPSGVPGIAPLTQGQSSPSRPGPGIAPLAQGSSSPSGFGSVVPGIAPLAQGSSSSPSGFGSVAPGIAPLAQGSSSSSSGFAPGIAPLTQGSSSPSGFGSVAPLAQGTASGVVPGLGAPSAPTLFPPTSSPSSATQKSSAQTAAEVRAAVVLADATAMRLFEAGAPLAPAPDLELIRRELERDEGLHLAVRFVCHAPRLLKTMDAAEGLIGERVVGAVEGLMVAEAWSPLATMLERLRATAELDAHHRWVCDLATGLVANSDQARRIVAWLREGPPADAEGLGRLLPFFGPAYASAWLDFFESLDLPASRDAVLPGLAALASLNPEPFLERLKPKRPRRLAELVYCLEKGRHPNRQRVVRELLGRLDPSRQREVLAGLARAGTDEGYRQLTQALSDEAEETRVLALQLLAKHFPERAFEAVSALLELPATATRSEAERRALWVAVGSSTSPAALDALVTELSQKPSLLNRAKVDARKLDALEGLAVMKAPTAQELMRRLAEDGAQSENVRAAALRHLRAAALIVQTEQTTAAWVAGSRRWDRTPPSWRDVLLDLSSLAAASRVLELDGPAFDIVFERLRHRLEALLAGGQASVTTSGALQVNSQAVQEGADPALERALKALQARGVAGFTFVRTPPRAELEQLARWLAAGAGAEGIETPSVTRLLATQTPPKAAPVFKVPAMSDFSREAMVRYVELILSFRGWLTERRANPRAEFPDARQLLFELVAALSSREVRFLGLAPRGRDRDAELFHAANVTMTAVAFGAELGLSSARLVDLATSAFFTDVGNLELKDETFERAGRLTDEDQRDVALARRASARFPFIRQGDKRAATAWATVVAEQEVDWGSRERAGGVGAHAAVGLMGSIVALARAYETLTTATSTREAMSPQAALEVLTQKVPHRFRPELLTLFARFLQRQTLRPLVR